jgi:hypothetical protein
MASLKLKDWADIEKLAAKDWAGIEKLAAQAAAFKRG